MQRYILFKTGIDFFIESIEMSDDYLLFSLLQADQLTEEQIAGMLSKEAGIV